MTTPRELLAEALHSGVLMHAASPEDVIQTNTPGVSVDGGLMRERLVEGLLAEPRLAAALEIGLAWEAAEKALPGDQIVHALHLIHRPDGAEIWQAVGGPEGWYLVSGEGPTPALALQALASRLQGEKP